MVGLLLFVTLIDGLIAILFVEDILRRAEETERKARGVNDKLDEKSVVVLADYVRKD